MRTRALLFSGFVFGIMALLHLIRIFYPFSLVVDQFSVPIYFSGFGFVFAGLLSSWMFYSARQGTDHDFR